MIDDSFRARFHSIPMAIHDLYVRLEDYRQTVYTAAHNHQELEILLINEGTVSVSVNNTSFLAWPGDIVLISPYAVHSLSFEPGVSLILHCICFNLSMLNHPTLARQLEEDQLAVSMQIASSHPLTKGLANAFLSARTAYIDRHNGWEMIAIGQIMTLFGTLYASGFIHPTVNPSRENRFCREVSRYINLHYAENLTSNILAKELSYDYSYFCRLFKKSFGKSFSNYLSMYRVFMAKQLIDKGIKSVALIANSVGYNHISYFSKNFQKYIGCLPSHYLKIGGLPPTK